MEMLSRYRGCLLAGAIGDALGYQVEFVWLGQIRRAYGEKGVRQLAPHISDDTQMTLFTGEGMLLGREHQMPMPACVYQAYLDWLHTQMQKTKGGCFRKQDSLLAYPELFRQEAPGNTCLSALQSGNMGTIDEPINNSKGCGGVMRAAPCGLLKMTETQDPEDAYAMQGAMAGAITHSHPMGYVPAAMLADIVHMILLEDGRTLEKIIKDSLDRMDRLFPGAGMADFRKMIERAMQLAQSEIPAATAIEALGGGWVGNEALAIAVYCVLKYPDDMEECLSAAVTHSGDSDSTGAVAGNIIGAWLGEEGIPEAWRGGVVLWDVIADMAERLYRAQMAG